MNDKELEALGRAMGIIPLLEDMTSLEKGELLYELILRYRQKKPSLLMQLLIHGGYEPFKECIRRGDHMRQGPLRDIMEHERR